MKFLCALVSACLVCSVTLAEDQFQWETDEAKGVSELKIGKQPVLRYMFAYDDSSPERLHDTYKVYHHVYGPGAQRVITKGPGGEYTHHRGLFLAWNKTGYEGKLSDFWHCTQGNHQRHAKFISQAADAKHGSMTAEIHWNDGQGKPVIVETRTVAASLLPAPVVGWQIDFTSSLLSQRGTITLDGDRQHAGVQFRADQPVAVAKSARYIRPAGFPEDPKAVEVNDATQPDAHVNLGWLAMTYELDGQEYTVQYCEDPALPKPSRYSERPYGRFGAFFKTQLEADKPLLLKYRLNVTAGTPPTRETLQGEYEAFKKSLAAN